MSIPKETIMETYLMHSKESLAEMLYDTIDKYESRTCKNCKYCNLPLSNQITNSEGFCINILTSLYPIKSISDFGCNKFLRKEND